MDQRRSDPPPGPSEGSDGRQQAEAEDDQSSQLFPGQEDHYQGKQVTAALGYWRTSGWEVLQIGWFHVSLVP